MRVVMVIDGHIVCVSIYCFSIYCWRQKPSTANVMIGFVDCRLRVQTTCRGTALGPSNRDAPPRNSSRQLGIYLYNKLSSLRYTPRASCLASVGLEFRCGHRAAIDFVSLLRRGLNAAALFRFGLASNENDVPHVRGTLPNAHTSTILVMRQGLVRSAGPG